MYQTLRRKLGLKNLVQIEAKNLHTSTLDKSLLSSEMPLGVIPIAMLILTVHSAMQVGPVRSNSTLERKRWVINIYCLQILIIYEY